jgi:hypothetical protein
LVYDKEIFIQRNRYVSKHELVALYDSQKHLSDDAFTAPVSLICERLREAKALRAKLDQGMSYEVLAKQKGITTHHLKRVIKLLNLPPEKIKLIEQDDPSIQTLNFRTALAEAHKHEQWLNLVKALDNADRWRVELSKGVSQADIARTEGLTRARVCQLLRLNSLDSLAKRQIRSGDERYYGFSLREIWG